MFSSFISNITAHSYVIFCVAYCVIVHCVIVEVMVRIVLCDVTANFSASLHNILLFYYALLVEESDANSCH
jgi:hypothetical protein